MIKFCLVRYLYAAPCVHTNQGSGVPSLIFFSSLYRNYFSMGRLIDQTDLICSNPLIFSCRFYLESKEREDWSFCPSFHAGSLKDSETWAYATALPQVQTKQGVSLPPSAASSHKACRNFNYLQNFYPSVQYCWMSGSEFLGFLYSPAESEEQSKGFFCMHYE